MSTVSIRGKLSKNKKAEFYLTIETIKDLIEKNCKEFNYELSEDNKLEIKIEFANHESYKNFDNLEFSILRGSIRNLCEDVEIDTSIKLN